MSRDKDLVNSKTVTFTVSTLQNKYEYDVNDNCIYTGTAPRGASADENVWTIERRVWVAGTIDGFNCTEKKTALDSWTNREFAEYL